MHQHSGQSAAPKKEDSVIDLSGQTNRYPFTIRKEIKEIKEEEEEEEKAVDKLKRINLESRTRTEAVN